jgi:hypothetical protein
MAVPKSTPEQRQAALAKAAEARRARAELKALVSTGSVTLAGTKVAALLVALPGMGKVKTKRLMEAEGIADNRRIRGLGSRQRAALLEQVG